MLNMTQDSKLVDFPIEYREIARRRYRSNTFDFVSKTNLLLGMEFYPIETRDEKLQMGADGYWTLVGGRFEKFIVSKKFRFKVAISGLDEYDMEEINRYFSSISSFVSDHWSFIPWQIEPLEYRMIFYFRRKADALLFKMGV